MSAQKAKKKKAASLRWHLVAVLAVFIALVLLVSWFFQVYLLNAFYEHVKRDQILEFSHSLADHLESKELPMLAYSYAIEGTMTVSVYRFENQEAVLLHNVDATGESGISYSEERLDHYYEKAHSNEGIYLSEFVFGGYEVDKNQTGFLPSVEGLLPSRIQPRNLRLICVRLVEDAQGVEHMILLNAAMQPLDATVKTLKTQYVWIIFILLFSAATMVFYLYRYISEPLVRMSASAKKLALGKYDVEFSEKGYREAIELAQSLNYASRELSRLDRLQKELIANISHDLRTPLTMIKGYSEIMRDLPGENTPENMQVVIDETTRLSELVNDLLDLSRIQSGSTKLQMESFDLTSALEETMKRYDAFTRHKGYHIGLDIDADVWIYADRSMILQVLYNLINNAINYTGEDKQVRVTQTLSEGRVRIGVTDTGEGISPEQMPLVWDRYYKVDKVHRRATIGTGLGLNIVKGILEMHGAAYGIESKLGEGSTFWFELPVLTSENTAIDRSDREE